MNGGGLGIMQIVASPVPDTPERALGSPDADDVLVENRSDDVPAESPADEPHGAPSAGRLNWLRAGVLGANDGIVSTAGIVVGVAGATSARGPIFTAGLAGLVAGSVSMALGEYVSVSSQRDSETGQLSQEQRELADTPAEELDELTALYRAKGLSPATARTVAEELTAHDALGAHLDAELHLDPDDLPTRCRPHWPRRRRSRSVLCCR
jgi:hypothetical protein